MLEICTGALLRPSTQCPSHCFSWSHTSEQTTLRGLFSNSISPAVSSWLFRNSWIMSGMGVLMGQPVRHWGTLQCRQRRASFTTWMAILCFLLANGEKRVEKHPGKSRGAAVR